VGAQALPHDGRPRGSGKPKPTTFETSTTHFSTFQEIYSGCCTNADCDFLSLGTVVGSPVAHLREALLDRDFDLRG
jgi:hypothetical protein